MNQTKIQEIVTKVFDKAKAECAVHSKNALCKHIDEQTTLSARTLERLHGKYISNKIKGREHNVHTINALCKYLGYDSFAAYVKKHDGGIATGDSKTDAYDVKKHDGERAAGDSKTDAAYVKEHGGEIAVGVKKNWIWAIGISLGIGVALLFYFNYKEYSSAGECMVWEKDHFEPSPCMPRSDKNIEPLDPVRLANFKKIEATGTTEFFHVATKQPLVWYHKNKNGEIEYYTAPGLHPINGKTLDEITPYIIDKYVPIHTFKPTSFTD
jgi:hypothetical protein